MADEDSHRYTARDLAALTGVSERTVRYYVGEGLLPPPLSRGRGANFGPTHLTRLQLIRAMQQAGNELEAIREYLTTLDSELAATGATIEAALAVWNGRVERVDMARRWRESGRVPQHLMRYRIAQGVELLIEPAAAPAGKRMDAIIKMLRETFEEEDED